MSADSFLNSHCCASHGERHVIVLSVKDFFLGANNGNGLSTNGALLNGALEAHQLGFALQNHLNGGKANKVHGFLGEAGFVKALVALQVGRHVAAAFHEVQTCRNSKGVHNTHNVLCFANGDSVVDSVASLGSSLVSGHLECQLSNRGGIGIFGTAGTNGDSGIVDGVCQIIVVGIEDLTLRTLKDDSLAAGGTFLNGTLEAHQLGFTFQNHGNGGKANKVHGFLGEAGFVKALVALQVGRHTAAALHEVQSFRNMQAVHNAYNILRRTDCDGVGDGITHICLGLVCCYRKVEGSFCRYRYCRSHQAYEQDKTQDD